MNVLKSVEKLEVFVKYLMCIIYNENVYIDDICSTLMLCRKVVQSVSYEVVIEREHS